MKQVPKSVQKIIVRGITKKIEDLFSNKHLISEDQIKKEYLELQEVIMWGKKNCSIYKKLAM